MGVFTLFLGRRSPQNRGIVFLEKPMQAFKILPLLALMASSVQAQNREVNIICSAQAAW